MRSDDGGTASEHVHTLHGSLQFDLGSGSVGRNECTCGYAVGGVVPRRLCSYPCSEAVSRAWRDEERRLLERLPAVEAEVSEILDAAIEKIMILRREPEEGIHALEASIRRRAGRDLRRANRRWSEEIAGADTTRWRALAALAALDGRDGVRPEATRWKRRGLGAARLSRTKSADMYE
ncbi:hypothetical protein [uncultured Microbacterium sp.]|uniref:hypothetical protein n=1 Tax=uncultured Microbacterium sp. TaxID=191216 RepID=UPI002624CD25|nr:hypothetical protein [uncultured Microbacterium sp.]